MGLFDSAFKLPSVSGIVDKAVNTAVGTGTKALSFAVAGATTKLTEATGAMLGSLGATGPFTKVASNLPTIEKMSASAVLSGGSASDDPLGDFLKKNDESSATASQIKAAAGTELVSVAHKVFLQEVGTKNFVYFEVMPEIVEQHGSDYEPVSPSQSPGAFQKYKGSSSTVWTVNVTFISRNSAEATQNYDNLMRLRGWMKPFYGERTGVSFPEKLGAPPPVLKFSGLRDLIGPVPVVITALSWTWPRDVDYIATDIISDTDKNFIPFPTVLQVPINLVESYAVDQFNQFSLADYRVGRLGTAFNKAENDSFTADQQIKADGN
jgi:hypothetical protein